MNPAVAMICSVVFFVAGGGVARVHGLPAGDGTPAARFWAKALPGTPMPEAIADLVQRGTDQSPVVALAQQHSGGAAVHPSACLGYSYRISCGPQPEGLFFHEAAMRAGATMTLSLPPMAPPPFLPRAAAGKAPFASLAAVLAAFGIAPGSDEAAYAGQTLRQCQEAPLAGERKACATSLEATVLSAVRLLALPAGAREAVAVAASAVPSAGLPRRAYTVQAVRAFGGGARVVACHNGQYPYAVYRCHTETSPSSKPYGYIVSIHGGDDLTAAISMAALCHRDTSNWSPDHPAFEILHTQPGGAPVCHFLPYGDLMFASAHNV